MSNRKPGLSAERGLEAGKVRTKYPFIHGQHATGATARRCWAAAAVVALALGGCTLRAQQADPAGDAEATPDPAALQVQTPEASADQENSAAAAAGNGPESSATESPAADPPARVLRLSVAHGNLSVEPAGVNTFSAAELNDVLTTGDRLYTDPAAQAELEGPQLAVRLGGGADLTVSAMTDTLAQFGLASGAVHLRAYGIDPGTVLELDTLEASVTMLQPGDVRVDEDPAGHVTTVDLLSGSAQVDGPGVSQVLTPGQSLRVHAADPDSGQEAYAEPASPGTPDALDSWDQAQDNAYASDADSAGAYVNADTVGFGDLANNGSWDTCDYGPVWFPVVAVDWVPYRHGHWRWRAPWGWTWVGSEPWGFAPYHYGRWVEWRGRWGWIPGPSALRPVYAPALVAFTEGRSLAGSLGSAPGTGITAWFPLGPREPYTPPYRGSTLYLNRVNASNIYDANTAQARAFYNQRAVSVFAGVTQARHTYANRAVATTAVPANSFTTGRPVNSAALRIAPGMLASAPVLTHPPVVPGAAVVAGRPARVRPLEGVHQTAFTADNTTGQSTPAVGGVLFVQHAQPPVPSGGLRLGRPLPPLEGSVRDYHPAIPARSEAPRSAPVRSPSAPAPMHSAAPAASTPKH